MPFGRFGGEVCSHFSLPSGDLLFSEFVEALARAGWEGAMKIARQGIWCVVSGVVVLHTPWPGDTTGLWNALVARSRSMVTLLCAIESFESTTFPVCSHL
eukprot:2398996-Amphidinium_carterae.1